MSYKDLEEARATRAARDATQEALKGQGKLSRKLKNVTQEAGEPEMEPEMEYTGKEVITGKKKGRRSRKSPM